MLIDGLDRTLAQRLPCMPAWLRSTIGAVLILGGFATVVGICVHDARAFVTQLTVIAPKIDALMAKDRHPVPSPRRRSCTTCCMC